MDSAQMVVMIVVVWVLIIGAWITWKRLAPSYSASVIVATKEARSEILKFYSDSKPGTQPIITIIDQHLPNLQSPAVQRLFLETVICICFGLDVEDRMQKFIKKTDWIKYK